jgi:putative hydrolase of the HAD superfamily
MAPRAILLDALGTLLALEPPAPRLRALLRERHGVDVADDDAQRALRSEMRYYRANCVRAADREALGALRLECAAILSRELGGAAAQLPAGALLPTLLDSIRFSVFDDVPAALARWRADGIRLVVASNWDVSLHDALRDTGLRELLDGAVSSAEVGASKPSSALFAAALATAGVESHSAVHVGDSLEEDVAGARAAGIEAVWLCRDGKGEQPTPPVRVIGSLDQLVEPFDAPRLPA